MRPTSAVLLAVSAVFIAWPVVAPALTPVAVTVADLDGDGASDAAVLGDDQLYLIRSKGDGTFEAFTPAAAGTRSTGGFAITSGFLDGDSAVDLVVANAEDAGTVSVLLGNGDGTFKTARLNNVGAIPAGVAVAKLNNDGVADIAVVDGGELADLNISLLSGNGDGMFKTDQRTTAQVYSIGIVAADFDQDGRIDLAVSNVSDGFGVTILRNDPSCSACVPPQCQCTNGFDLIEIPDFGNAQAIQAGDLDGDGKPDLVVLSDDGTILGVLKNTTASGTGISFAVTMIDVALAADSPNEMILADVNKDGRPDVLAINDTNDGIDVFLNNKSGGFTAAPKSIAAGEDLVAIASGDFDADGSPDVVATDDATETAIFLFGNGKGGLGRRQDVDLTTGPPCTGDCDGSGAVTVGDLITMVNIALETAPVSMCTVGDVDGSGGITVNEILKAVAIALTSCPSS